MIFNKDYKCHIKVFDSYALVTLNSHEDVNEFMKLYLNYSHYNFTEFSCNYYKDKQQLINEHIFNDPLAMFSHFSKMTIHDQSKKPVIVVNEQSLDDLAGIVYGRAEEKYHG
jgi:hypothetical protein